MAMERRNSGKLHKSGEKNEDDEDKKGGLLSKLGVSKGKRLSTGHAGKMEKPTSPGTDNPSDFHYKGHRPTHEEMVAHLESFQRSRTPTTDREERSASSPMYASQPSMAVILRATDLCSTC
jgi:hypothetical protein